jgi:hypothetical protein
MLVCVCESKATDASKCEHMAGEPIFTYSKSQWCSE